MGLITGAQRRDDNRAIIPDHVAGILGIPYVGKTFYVDPTNGSDTTNGGTRPTDAFASITAAEDSLITHNHDVVIMVPGGTGGTSEAATITWDKSYCHLIGNTAPTFMSPRSRVIWTTDSIDPCITISGKGCIFKNIQLSTLQASNDVLVSLTGNNNFFENVHFFGIGHTTAGDDATARHIAMTGAVNNTFKHCTIGDDTIARSTSNASLEFISSSSKNLFEDCFFTMNADNTAALHVKSTGTGGISGVNEFRNCTWMAKWTNAADKIAAVFDISAQTQTCAVLMTGRQLMVGADDWEASASNKLFFEPYTSTTSAIGIGVNNS